MSGINGKRPGSRRYNTAARSGFGGREWHEGTPPALEVVGIDFLCERKGHAAEIVGQVRMNTSDGGDRTISMETLPGGKLPEEAGRPQGQGKFLLGCDRCGNEKQVSEAVMTEALNAMWAPHARRVVTYRI